MDIEQRFFEKSMGKQTYPNPQLSRDILSKFTPEEIAHSKNLVEEADRQCEAALPTLPAEIEQTINECIEQMKTKAATLGLGNVSPLTLPMCRHMMRLGALIALAADVKNWKP